MQMTLVPREKERRQQPRWLVRGPLTPRQIARSLSGQAYYVSLTRSLRRIPDNALKYLLAARRARALARATVAVVKALITLAAALVFAHYIAIPLVDKFIR